VFVNADLIAAGLSPFAPEKAAIRAGKIMLQEVAEHIRCQRSFALETTLSGLSYARQIPVWQAAGYSVTLYFLALASAEQAVARVAARVEQGGHNIPGDVIRRRFEAGLRNFSRYRQLVDSWSFYDNSGRTPVLLDQGDNS